MGAVKAVKAVSKVLVRVNGVVALDMRVHRRVRAKRALLASFYKVQKVTSMLDYAASRNAKKHGWVSQSQPAEACVCLAPLQGPPPIIIALFLCVHDENKEQDHGFPSKQVRIGFPCLVLNSVGN